MHMDENFETAIEFSFFRIDLIITPDLIMQFILTLQFITIQGHIIKITEVAFSEAGFYN